MPRKKKSTRKKSSTTKKKMTARGGKRRGRRPKLATISTTDLQAELSRRRGELEDRRTELESELDQVNSELGAMDGGTATRGRATGNGRRKKRGRGPGRPPGRPKKTTRRGGGRRRSGSSLADYLEKVLTGQTLSVAEATAAVKSAGYKSQSPNLRNMVNQQLSGNRKRFRKVARGRYTAAA